MKKLLPWQQRCLDQFNQNPHKKDFVLIAGTGCGKTAVGMACARSAFFAEPVEDRIIFVACPYRGIKKGWKKWGKKMGLAVATKPAEVAADVQVIVSTYQGARAILDYLGAFLGNKKLILVFDEFHHMEENNSWARPFEAMSKAQYVKRIFLSGTPWHETGDIGLVGYDDDGLVQADFTYTYGENVNGSEEERNTVEVIFRPHHIHGKRERKDLDTGDTFFEPYDSENTRRSDSMAQFVDFTTVLDILESKKQDTEGSGLYAMFEEAVAELDAVRGILYKAGGIVFVGNRKQGNAVVDLLRLHFDKQAKLIISDDPKAHSMLESFANDNAQEWLVAIDMVSEGVDIPRLKVVVDVSNRTTLMHIVQRWGRVLRLLRDPDGNPETIQVDARIFYINHAQLQYVAEEIEKDIRKFKRVRDPGGGDGPEPRNLVTVSNEQEGEARQWWFKGESLEDNINRLADWILINDFNKVASSGLGFKGALNLAQYLANSGNVPDDFKNETRTKKAAEPDHMTLKADVCTKIESGAGQIAYRYFDGNFRDANTEINNYHGVPCWTKKNKTLEELESRLKAVKETEKMLMSLYNGETLPAKLQEIL